MKVKSLINYFSRREHCLLCASFLLIMISFALSGRNDYITLCASLIGVTSLILIAKGNPLGQLLLIIFSLLYGIIAYSYNYYGEMITYLGMSAPISLLALISWLHSPYNGNMLEVEVNELKRNEYIFLFVLSAVITGCFYYILKSMNTQNLVPSTISITTSFLAAYLTFRRSPFFALCYAANDIVLIVLWTLAVFDDISYLSVDVCFIVFLINDIYGYISWSKMKVRQNNLNLSSDHLMADDILLDGQISSKGSLYVDNGTDMEIAAAKSSS